VVKLVEVNSLDVQSYSKTNLSIIAGGAVNLRPLKAVAMSLLDLLI